MSCVYWLTRRVFLLYFSFLVEYVWHVLFYWVCVFSLQWKGTYWSTNQSLHIRVTINCFFASALLTDNTNCLNFFLWFLNGAHKKIVFFSTFPNVCEFIIFILFCSWQQNSCCWCFGFVRLESLFRFLFVGCLFWLLYLKKVSYIIVWVIFVLKNELMKKRAVTFWFSVYVADIIVAFFVVLLE